MSEFRSGFRVVADKTRPMIMMIDGAVAGEFDRDPKQKNLKAGLYDLDMKYLGQEAEDGSLIPAEE
jgi:hypothetical protein